MGRHPFLQLPSIWAELGEAGLESGHAYGNALRTVKSCVGPTWCRYGVQDALSFAVRLENRYKGELLSLLPLLLQLAVVDLLLAWLVLQVW